MVETKKLKKRRRKYKEECSGTKNIIATRSQRLVERQRKKELPNSKQEKFDKI